jgi:hypothetical protein
VSSQSIDSDSVPGDLQNVDYDYLDMERKILNDILDSIVPIYVNIEQSSHSMEMSNYREAPIVNVCEPPSFVNVAKQQNVKSHSPSMKIIGTSMMRNIGSFCHTVGLNACSFSYPGAKIHDITNNIRSYLSPNTQPTYVVLHAGGNDLEVATVRDASYRMDELISAVKLASPTSKIILSAISPRKQNGFLNLKIAMFNELLQLKANAVEGIFFVECIPLNLDYYGYDMVHFNDKGKQFFADRLAKFMSQGNFQLHQDQRSY